MSQKRPSVFLASSSHDKQLLEAVANELRPHATLKLWTEEGFSSLGSNILDWVTEEATKCEFGLFLLSPDNRWGDQPNGNVLLELGLFIGTIGASRSFVLKPTTFPIPADLTGRILAEYDHDSFVRDGPKALSNAIRNIVIALRRHSETLAVRIGGTWLEMKNISPPESPYSLVQFDAVADRPRVHGRSYYTNGDTLAEWPDAVSVPWVCGEHRLYHMFDAKVGHFEESTAIGVTVYNFESSFNAGNGYYVVHGGADVQKGATRFTLKRITPALLRSTGLDPAPLSLDDYRRCAEFIKELTAGGLGPSSACDA